MKYPIYKHFVKTSFLKHSDLIKITIKIIQSDFKNK